jgi:hypothetical protein
MYLSPSWPKPRDSIDQPVACNATDDITRGHRQFLPIHDIAIGAQNCLERRSEHEKSNEQSQHKQNLADLDTYIKKQERSR